MFPSRLVPSPSCCVPVSSCPVPISSCPIPVPSCSRPVPVPSHPVPVSSRFSAPSPSCSPIQSRFPHSRLVFLVSSCPSCLVPLHLISSIPSCLPPSHLVPPVSFWPPVSSRSPSSSRCLWLLLLCLVSILHLDSFPCCLIRICKQYIKQFERLTH